MLERFTSYRRALLAIFIMVAIGAVWVGYSTLVLPQERMEEVQFTAVDADTSVTARLNSRVAYLSGLGIDSVRLTAVETAVGVRYEDRVSGVTLWKNGTEATIYQNGAIVFTGVQSSAEGESDAAVPTRIETALMGETWVWRETLMSNGLQTAPSTPGAFSLLFSEGVVQGGTDCNNFSGSFTLSNASLVMGPFRATKMYCAGSTESEFMAALTGTTTVLFDPEGNLVILLADDAGSVFFTKATSSRAE